MGKSRDFPADAIARLHAESLPLGFLQRLGPEFLALLYDAMEDCPEAVVIFERDPQSQRLLGFVAGGYGMSPVYKAMLTRPGRLASVGLSLLLKPRVWRGMLEILRHARGNDLPPDLPEAELFAIAVAPEARGTGLAARLFCALQEHFGKRGTPAFQIVVGDALAPAHAFYRKMGAQAACSVQIHAGCGSTIYTSATATPPNEP